MLLPKSSLTDLYEKPRVFLCETDKTIICPLETSDMQGTFKFNAYSTLSFDVARVYTDIITGETKVNPYYDKIEAIRLILLEGFGYFEIQDPEINGDGIKEVKTLQANSLEYTLSQKYVEDLKINMGTVDSMEVMYASDLGIEDITPITFYDPTNPKLSLLHIALEKAYGWSIAHVDPSLQTMRRQFEIDRESIYDFIMKEICEKFNCYAVFNTFENTVSFYAEAPSYKFNGNGSTKTFILNPPFTEIGRVSIDGYNTTEYMYNVATGELTLTNDDLIPEFDAIVEVTDGSASAWETDVFVTFDNLAEEMNISYSSDDIKTVLTVTGADDMHIREVNSGLPYIVDLSYFHNNDWMGNDLYGKYEEYDTLCKIKRSEYRNNAKEILRILGEISHEENRLSLGYAEASVSAETRGTYYIRGWDETAGYYYQEIVLTGDNYDPETTYYLTTTTNVNWNKISKFFEALQTYFMAYFDPESEENVGDMTGFTGEDQDSEAEDEDSAGEDSTGDEDDEDENYSLVELFNFMNGNDKTYTYNALIEDLTNGGELDVISAKILNFLNGVWYEIGKTPLNSLFYEPYKKVQTTNVSAGWAEENHENYGQYYPVVLMLQSLETAMAERQAVIDQLTNKNENKTGLNDYYEANEQIGESLLMDNFFTEDQMIRLSAFLREDEYMDENFLETGLESTEELLTLKQQLLECGRIELSKICSPALKFSMSLANIYALPEFEPIMNQFQLGNLIKVALRDDYIKHTRLMEVKLNFEDFSDFSCEFGDLSSVRSQSDLHADLLSGAISAGNTVASSASYWNSGADAANSIDLRIQQGLLDAAASIRDIEGDQLAYIDKYGIHLQEMDPNTGEISPKQGWLVNNRFLYTDDAFKTVKSVFGEYKIGNDTFWGLLAEAVIAGYIEGSKIVGGTIQIGEIKDEDGNVIGYNFEVDESGHITMIGGSSTTVNGTSIDIDWYNTNVEISASNLTITPDGSATLTCNVYKYNKEITNSEISKITWVRETGDASADSNWSALHTYTYEESENSIANTCQISASDINNETLFYCTVTFNDGERTKTSNNIIISPYNSTINVFRSKPDSVMEDGSYYHVGDLWVVGKDYQPLCYDDVGNVVYNCNEHHTHTDNCKKHKQNAILVCVADGTTAYSDADWRESTSYSQAVTNLNGWMNVMQEHVQILEDGLYLIGADSEQNGSRFEAKLDSRELGFYQAASGQEKQKLIWIGNKDGESDKTHVKDLGVENHINVQPENNSTLPYIKLGNFSLQIEENGSLSLV